MAFRAPESLAASKIDLGDTFGIAYIGAMLSMILYGITTLQSYLYYMYYPKDDRSFKILVATIWVLETLHIAFVCHAMYFYLISNYANPLALEFGIWSLYTTMLCNIMISTIVQVFFAVRVHILSSKRWWLTAIIALSIAAHFAFGLETVIDLIILKEFIKIPTITYKAALPFAVTAVIPDVLIAASLCFFLQSGKSGFRGTNALINQLMIYAINRCLLTSAVAIVEVILFKALPASFYFLAVDFCIGKLYANSLLATLNTRKSLRGKGYDTDTLSTGTRSLPTPQTSPFARRDVPIELTDLRATWPSDMGTHDNTDSFGGTDTNLHRSVHRKDEMGATITSDIVSDIEEQPPSIDERKPERCVSFHG